MPGPLAQVTTSLVHRRVQGCGEHLAEGRAGGDRHDHAEGGEDALMQYTAHRLHQQIRSLEGRDG